METLQISNDAYYFLKNGEEPLDDLNLQEGLDIKKLYLKGYIISRVEFAQDDDLVEIDIDEKHEIDITFYPTWDYSDNFNNIIEMRYKILDSIHGEYAIYDLIQQRYKFKAKADIVDIYGHKWFKNGITQYPIEKKMTDAGLTIPI
jgi:hypothetical protein